MELLSESYEEVAELAKILGKPERGEQLNADFKQHLRTSAPKRRRTCIRASSSWGGDTPFAFRTENTAASIVAALGGDNIAGPMAAGRSVRHRSQP